MVFSAAPATPPAATGAPPADFKPAAIVTEPANNPVEAFIGELALALQNGPFHRFFQRGEHATAAAAYIGMPWWPPAHTSPLQLSTSVVKVPSPSAQLIAPE